MTIPQKAPGFNLLLVIWGVYAAVWISREGALWQVVTMGAMTTVVLLSYGWQRWLGGRTVRPAAGALATAVSGLLLGMGSGLLSLLFMAVKTGLHAHGPEFTPMEIAWVWHRLPLWTAVGLLVGLGLGLIWAGSVRRN